MRKDSAIIRESTHSQEKNDYKSEQKDTFNVVVIIIVVFYL